MFAIAMTSAAEPEESSSRTDLRIRLHDFGAAPLARSASPRSGPSASPGRRTRDGAPGSRAPRARRVRAASRASRAVLALQDRPVQRHAAVGDRDLDRETLRDRRPSAARTRSCTTWSAVGFRSAASRGCAPRALWCGSRRRAPPSTCRGVHFGSHARASRPQARDAGGPAGDRRSTTAARRRPSRTRGRPRRPSGSPPSAPSNRPSQPSHQDLPQGKPRPGPGKVERGER